MPVGSKECCIRNLLHSSHMCPFALMPFALSPSCHFALSHASALALSFTCPFALLLCCPLVSWASRLLVLLLHIDKLRVSLESRR